MSIGPTLESFEYQEVAGRVVGASGVWVAFQPSIGSSFHAVTALQIASEQSGVPQKGDSLSLALNPSPASGTFDDLVCEAGLGEIEQPAASRGTPWLTAAGAFFYFPPR